jgi:two-component system, chemotaxis family, protein-glutamate methylesterase/glutaminase
MKKIRVLIVDDSAFMRKAIRRMLSTAPDIEVIDTASDGQEALVKTAELRPDLITLDVKMTGMDGITALERLMREHPTPVLMLSSLTHEGTEVTLKALELGAVDFIDKTRAESSMDITLLANELIAKVRTIAGVDIGKMKSALSDVPGPAPAREKGPRRQDEERVIASERVEVVAIGTSTGGPPALSSLIPRLPRNFSAGVIVVQHMPVGFTRTLAERLNAQSQVTVAEAVEGDRIEPGRVLVAPAGKHLKLRRLNGSYVVHLDTEPSDSAHKPSVDVMMESVAKACGTKALGVLLTGMGHDGAQGMRAIKAAGGTTFAESEETCIVYGMPKSAVEEGVVDKVLPLYDMAAEILKAL